MVVDQRRANTPNLVSTHRRSSAAAADCHPAIHLPADHRLRQRDHIVGIVIPLAQTMSTEIDNLMSCVTKLGNQLLLQAESTVIGGNTHSHSLPFVSVCCQPRDAGHEVDDFGAHRLSERDDYPDYVV